MFLSTRLKSLRNNILFYQQMPSYAYLGKDLVNFGLSTSQAPFTDKELAVIYIEEFFKSFFRRQDNLSADC